MLYFYICTPTMAISPCPECCKSEICPHFFHHLPGRSRFFPWERPGAGGGRGRRLIGALGSRRDRGRERGSSGNSALKRQLVVAGAPLESSWSFPELYPHFHLLRGLGVLAVCLGLKRPGLVKLGERTTRVCLWREKKEDPRMFCSVPLGLGGVLGFGFWGYSN